MSHKSKTTTASLDTLFIRYARTNHVTLNTAEVVFPEEKNQYAIGHELHKQHESEKVTYCLIGKVLYAYVPFNVHTGHWEDLKNQMERQAKACCVHLYSDNNGTHYQLYRN